VHFVGLFRIKYQGDYVCYCVRNSVVSLQQKIIL